MNLIEFHVPTIVSCVRELNADSAPKWGSMSPATMLAHLIDIARISNGKLKVDFANKPEYLPKLRHILYKEAPFPEGFAAPAQIEELINAVNQEQDLSHLTDELERELTAFECHFAADGQKEVNAVFGPLDKADWIQFHRKHISHHLGQFGLWSYD